MYERVNTVLQNSGLGFAYAYPKTLTLPHGSTGTLLVTVVSDNGIPMDLEGASVALRMVHPVGGHVLYQVAVLGVARSSQVALALAPPSSLQVGSYHWDLWHTVVATGVKHQIFPLSSFLIVQTSQ